MPPQRIVEPDIDFGHSYATPVSTLRISCTPLRTEEFGTLPVGVFDSTTVSHTLPTPPRVLDVQIRNFPGR